jgi:four helix bundle protein
MAGVTRVEDLAVYRKLCELHIELSALTRAWPRDERFELASQVRRASNSAPANLAEKHSDRHVRNRIEGVNRARGEALETIHHLFIATLKGYVARLEYDRLRGRYEECVRMLNGLERALEQQLPPEARQWPTREEARAKARLAVRGIDGSAGAVAGLEPEN